MNTWGKDHWFLLSYIGSCCVDNDGVLDATRMRINCKRHLGTENSRGQRWEDGWGTRLRGFFKDPHSKKGLIPWHDDIDCLDDMESEGLIVNLGTNINFLVELTEKGQKIEAILRKHKMKGGVFVNFYYPDEKID